MPHLSSTPAGVIASDKALPIKTRWGEAQFVTFILPCTMPIVFVEGKETGGRKDVKEAGKQQADET